VRSLVVIAILAASARADPPETIVLPAGDASARATIATDTRGTLALEPDLWIGATDRLTLGATSSEEARGWVGATRGACVHDCVARYGGAAADARFRVRDGDVQLAGRAALDFRAFGPGVLALELGVAARSRAGALTVTVEPYLSLGIVNASLGNHTGAVVPLGLAWDLGRAEIGARAAVRGDLDGFFATAQLAGALSIDVRLTDQVSVGAGGGAPRAAWLYIAWRHI
jgi:hypothetical protein